MPQKPDVKNIDVETFNLEHEIEDVLSRNSSEIKELLKKLSNARKFGLAKSGELSPENIEFKKLRDMGLISKLRDAYDNALDTELSVESSEENK